MVAHKKARMEDFSWKFVGGMVSTKIFFRLGQEFHPFYWGDPELKNN